MRSRPPRWATRAGATMLAAMAVASFAAPALAPHTPADIFAGRAYAPPMRIRVLAADGLRAPFVYPQRLESRIDRRFVEDTSEPVALQWGRSGKVASIDAEHGPLLLLGADTVGRDVFSRLLYGARLSLGVTLTGVAGALLLGALTGGLAGAVGGRVETILMLLADFIIVLPGAYLVLVLRGVLPRELAVSQVFALMAVLFAVAGAPHVARGVRAIVAGERVRDYAIAARAAGAGPWRVMRHLLPAASGFLAVQAVLLVPALLVAEVTISFLDLGFPDDRPSWGTMLQAAGNTRLITEAPWMLAPAVALFLVALAVQLTVGRHAPAGVLTLADATRRAD